MDMLISWLRKICVKVELVAGCVPYAKTTMFAAL